MASIKSRTYRVLAWALAITLTVLSLPMVPFSTFSSDVTESIRDSVSLNAHAYSYDDRPRRGAWWWHQDDGTDAKTRDTYLELLESAGITEIYYYAGWDFTGSSMTSAEMSEIHTFVAAAMEHGMAVSFLMDDVSYFSKMANNFVTYRETYPSDWAYGFHFDYEGSSTSFLQGFLDGPLTDAVTYMFPNNIYVEFDVNPAWNNGTSLTYTFNGTKYTGFYNILANVLADGRGCVCLMAYRTASAQAIYNRANEGTEKAFTQCVNAGCDVVIGMECTEHESDGSVLQSNVSLAVYGVDKEGVVDYMTDLDALMAASGITSDYGVAIHHARSFYEDIDGTIPASKTTSYQGDGTTTSRTQGSYSQQTTTTKDISGQTLTKTALYYKSGLSTAVSAGGKYTDSSMSAAVIADYTTNGAIDTSLGEYYEIILTGTNSESGDYLYPVMFGTGEYWPSSYSGNSVSTSSSTVTAFYGEGSYVLSNMTLGLYHENSGTFTVKTIEINVYRYASSGDSSETTEPTTTTTATTTTTTTTVTATQTTATQGSGGSVSGNLIVNGDFSNDLTGWTASPSSIAGVTDGQLNISGNYYKDITVNASFSEVVGNGKTYTLRFDLTNTSGVSVKVHNKSGDGSGARQTYTESGTYTFTTDTGVSSDSTDSKTKFSIYVAGTKDTDLSAVLDNFVLVEGTSITEDDDDEESSVTPTTYSITVNNGTADKSTAAAGDTVTVTANDAATGYRFSGWTATGVTLASASNTVTTFTMPAANVTVTANYTKIDYTVTVSLGTASKTTANYGDTITLTADSPATGMAFDKWVVKSGSTAVSFANASSTSTTFTMPAGNVSVEAAYKSVTYTVTVTNGTASPSTQTYNNTVTVTANTPASGYQFSGWTSSDGITFADASSSTTTFVMPAKNVSVTANYTAVAVDPDAPQAPVLVSAAADGANVIVTWNAVSGAAGYRVYRKTGSGTYATVKDIADGTAVSCTDTALAAGTYTYTVQAYVTGSSGAIWGDYDATGKTATVTFGTPVLTSAVASASGITVTWQKVADATGYRLYRKNGDSWVTVKTLAGADTVSYLAKGLIAGSTYTYTVQAYYDSAVTSTTQWSGYDTTGVSAVAQFGSPESEAQADGMKITITWDTVSGAEGYRIYRKTADSSWRTLTTVTAPATTYTDETPVPNVYYTYTVQAYTTENNSRIYSAYNVTGTTKRVTLETPVLSDAEVTGDGVVVSWEATTGATGYRLYRWNGTAWKTVKTVIGINNTSYTDTSASAVADTKYTVQAFRNANGVVVWSSHDSDGVIAA